MRNGNSLMRLGFCLLAMASLPVTRGEARQDPCRDRSRDEGERVCTTSEISLSRPAGALEVDGRVNGGVRVTGTARRDIRVKARIEANARTRGRAEEIAAAIRIHSEEGRVYATGPDTREREWWSVSYEIEVPAAMDLSLTARNGGLTVEGVTGTLRLATRNGGIHLAAVNGDVVAETSNGGVTVRLEGDRWEGKGLEATTMNGGVDAVIPRDYSAHLVTGTTNGGIDIDFPVMVQGRIGRRIATDLGKGGATIRLLTTNGGVDIRSR